MIVLKDSFTVKNKMHVKHATVAAKRVRGRKQIAILVRRAENCMEKTADKLLQPRLEQAN